MALNIPYFDAKPFNAAAIDQIKLNKRFSKKAQTKASLGIFTKHDEHMKWLKTMALEN